MIRAAFLALVLLWPGAASAQRLALHVGDLGGMLVPNYHTDSVCSPVCIGASVDMVIPVMSASGKGGNSNLFMWLGLKGVGGITSNVICTSSTCDCTAGCLEQFGVEIDGNNLLTTPTFSIQGFWEVFGAAVPLFNFTFAAQPRDVVRLSMQCLNNCTNAAASQTWSVTLAMIRNGAVITTVDRSSDFNKFSLGFNQAEAGIEVSDPNATFPPIAFSHFKVNQSGCTTGCTTAGLSLTNLSQNNITFQTSGSGTNTTYVVGSGSFNGGSDFNSCLALTQTPLTMACAATPFTGPGTFSQNVHRLLEKNRIMEAMR